MSANQLRDLILNNDEDGVKNILQARSAEVYNLVNSSVDLPDSTTYPSFERENADTLADDKPIFSSLHYAIVNVFTIHQKDLTSARKALSIWRLLLRRGSNPCQKAINVRINFGHMTINITAKGRHSISLFQNLARVQRIFVRSDGEEVLYKLQRSLRAAFRNWRMRYTDNATLPLKVYGLLASFRSCPSNDFMTFICEDGRKIRAHRSVLSFYSPVCKS
jgi:hypothetical protein